MKDQQKQERRDEVASLTAQASARLPAAEQRRIWMTAQARDLIESRMEDAGYKCPDSGQMMLAPFAADFGIEIDGHLYDVQVTYRRPKD